MLKYYKYVTIFLFVFITACKEDEKVWSPLKEFNQIESEIEMVCSIRARVSTSFSGNGSDFKFIKVLFLNKNEKVSCNNQELRRVIDKFMTQNYGEIVDKVYIEKYVGGSLQMEEI